MIALLLVLLVLAFAIFLVIPGEDFKAWTGVILGWGFLILVIVALWKVVFVL